MSTAELVTTLKKYYQNVQPQEGNIFRCERREGKNPYQVIYFDNSEHLKQINSTDLLSDYIREKLITDYFNHPGAIQWNYYYAFLVDDLNQKKEKSYVYSNNEFARKFIVQRNNLETWLKQEYDIEKPLLKSTAPQLTSIWMEEFEKKGYPFIFDVNTQVGAGWHYILSGDRPKITEVIKDDKDEVFNVRPNCTSIM